MNLPPGTIADALTIEVPLDDVATEQVLDGSPRIGFATLHESEAGEIGVWEMTPGAMSDTEENEIFVVLAGEATVEFVEPAQPSIELRPGSVVRLTAGMRTTWAVTQTLRKVYVLSAA